MRYKATICVRCGQLHEAGAQGEDLGPVAPPEKEPAPCEGWKAVPRESVSKKLVRDGRTDEQVRADTELARVIRERMTQGLRPDGSRPVRATSVTEVAADARPLYGRDVAMRGKAGIDYLPKDACKLCGGVPWFNGRRYVEEHDEAKHNVDPAGAGDRRHMQQQDRSGESIAASVESVLARHQQVRRATGDRDEED